MALSLIGVLPVSAINIGLVAAFPAITAQIAKLNIDLANLALALAAQVVVSLNIPSLPQLALGIAAQIQNLQELLNPLNLINVSAGLTANGVIRLGFIEAQIALVGEIAGTLQAGLDLGGLSLWTYAGRAAGFGTQLAAQTVNGYPGIGADEQIQGVIVATEDFDSWGNFSATFNTGTTAQVNPADATNIEKLTFEGTLRGAQLNTGVLDLFLPINLYLLELEALSANLQLQLEVAIGINLPPLPQLLLALNVDLKLLLSNLINVNVDILFQIELVTLEIAFLIELIASITLSISAGGLAVWSYSGRAGDFGAGLQTALAQGVPGGSGPDVPAYGIAIATKLPEVWAAFGLIFGVV